MTVVYFIRANGLRLIKIGYTYQPRERLAALTLWSPVELEILAYAPGAFLAEALVQDKFRHLRSHSEWFFETRELSEYIGRVAETDFLELDGLPADHVSVDYDVLYSHAEQLLAQRGLTMKDFAKAAGARAPAVRMWKESRAIGYPHIGALVRFLTENGNHVTLADILVPRSTRFLRRVA